MHTKYILHVKRVIKYYSKYAYTKTPPYVCGFDSGRTEESDEGIGVQRRLSHNDGLRHLQREEEVRHRRRQHLRRGLHAGDVLGTLQVGGGGRRGHKSCTCRGEAAERAFYYVYKIKPTCPYKIKKTSGITAAISTPGLHKHEDLH